MNKFTRVTFKLFDLFIIFMMVFGSPMSALAESSPTGATVVTDLPDYPPGAIVTMTGAGWAAQEAVHIVVNDQVGNTWILESNPDPVADDAGGFTYEFQLPDWFIATYLVTATGYASGTATVTFTDDNIGLYDQCSNDLGTGYTTGNTGCRWINGNLQANNSRYFEGDATVQRIWLTGLIPGSSHTLTFRYATTKGGTHAYDFLTRWDWSESWITDADRCEDITGCTSATDTYTAIPPDPNANGYDVAANLIKPRQFTMRGGTLTSASTPAIFSGDYSGDSETDITINFTVNSSGSMCSTKNGVTTCGVAIWFGAHVAAQANWGLGMGAGSIPGSPYHVAIISQDGSSVGNRDNQMQANVVTVVPNGTIVIVKDASPDDIQDFSFNLQNDPLTVSQDFPLDDDSDATLLNSKTFSVPPGTWYASELNIPTGWTLSKLVCSVTGTNGSSSTTDLTTAKAAITLKSNDTVTCTFTDTKNQGKDLTVTKTATASFSRLYKWLIDKTVDQTAVNIAEGGKVTFNYSVKVTPDGSTDSKWMVTGKITVANSNGFAISGVNVTDTIDNGGTCTVTNGTDLTIPANDSVVLDYSCDYATAPSFDSGTNTATAKWTASDYYGTSGSASGTAGVDFSKVTPTESNKTITVVDDQTDPKNSVTLGTWNWGDGEHTFDYSLDKTGVAGTCTDYTNTAVIDETDQSDSQTVTVCVGKDLTVSKTTTASLTRTYQWKIDKSVDDSRIEIADGNTATFNYTVKVTPNGYLNSGFALGGSITIKNPNDWEDITLTSLDDTLDQGGTCSITESGPYVVPKSDSLTVHYTCASDDTSTLNTATATWDNTQYFTPTGSASGTADVKFTITEANKTITVADDKTDPANPVTLGTSDYFTGPFEFTYSLTKQGVAGKCTSYDNTATIKETDQSAKASAEVCVGKDLTVTKTAAGTFNRTYLWDITKKADKTQVKMADGSTATFTYTVDVTQTGIRDAGWTLSGKLTITNPNDWEDIMLTGITDVMDKGGTCTVDPTLPIVAKGQSVDVSYSCSFDEAPTSYNGKNTAAVTWNKELAFTPTNTAEASADFALTQLDSTNQTIHVTDSVNGDLGTVVATDPPATPASASFTYERTITGVAGKCTTYDNTATIKDTGQKADASVEVCVAKDLTVTKTAAGTFDRTYLWKISKDVDKTSVNIAEGDSYTFHYTVDVEQTGISDAGWTVSGKITITNPNDWEAIMLTGLTDVVDNGGTCTVDPTLPLVPKGGSVDVNYSCTYATKPASYSGQNTATVNWNQALAFTPTDTATGTADFALNQIGSTNKTVHVTDSFKGDLGTVGATDTSPYAKGTFTYDRTESGVGGKCTTYDNTATITETGDTASKTVTLCVAKDLTVTKTAVGSFDRTYKWLIDKGVDETKINIAAGSTATFNYTVGVTANGYTDSGWTMNGTITVTNPNDWEAIPANVTDVYDGGGVCTVTGGANVSVPAGQAVTLNYSCVFATQPTYTGKNTATAAWDKAAFFTPTGTATGQADVALILKGETDRTVTVVDDKTDPANPVSLGISDYYAGPFEYKYSLDKPGVAGTCTDYTNTATIKETTQSDTQKVTVCVAKDLTVTKTVTPTFTRTFLWDISKGVDKTLVRLNSGSATFNYTVIATQTGFTDSDWKVTGKITITNPNDWEAIMLTGLTDAVDNDGTCTVDPTLPLVPKGGSVDVNYSCTYATKPTSYSGQNTATVNWNQALAFTPTDSASGTQTFAFDDSTAGNPTNVDKTVNVTDTFNGTTTTLGTLTGTSSIPYTTHTYTYSHTIPVPEAACKSYPNTAKILSGTKVLDQDSETVTVCRSSLVTSSQLCTVPNNQWRLVFTPAVDQSQGYKLNATNPGQTFYNIFYTGAGNEDITITLPYPYVTQGAVPIHVYSNVGVTTSGGITCLTPSGELANENDQVTLSSYTPQAFGSTYQVTVHVPAVSGFAYINIHLDYGLKGTTGYAKGGPSGNDAVDKTNTSIVRIPDLKTYIFSDTAGGSYTVSTTNVFKKNPGIGGKGNNKLTDDPVPTNTKVVITDANKKVVATIYTDEDGWYMWSYKYTGKAATFYVTMSGVTQSITLKSNAYVEVDFVLP